MAIEYYVRYLKIQFFLSFLTDVLDCDPKAIEKIKHTYTLLINKNNIEKFSGTISCDYSVASW